MAGYTSGYRKKDYMSGCRKILAMPPTGILVKGIESMGHNEGLTNANSTGRTWSWGQGEEGVKVSDW